MDSLDGAPKWPRQALGPDSLGQRHHEEKNKHGKWTIDPDSRVLTEVNEKRHSKYRIQEEEAIPRVLMIAKCGGKAGFEEALNLGEIIEV